MTKWDLSQGCKDSSVYAIQSVWHTIWTNWRMKTIWSSLIDAEKAFDKTDRQKLQKVGIEGTYLNIKATYDKPPANNILLGEKQSISAKIRNRTRMSTHCYYSTVIASHRKLKPSLSVDDILYVSQFSSVSQSCLTFCGPMDCSRLPCPSPTCGVYSNSFPLGWWSHLTISSSVVPFSCLQSFPASGSFQMSQFFASGGQSTGFNFSISPSSKYSGLISFRMDWFDVLVVQGTLSRGFSNTTVRKHQFFSAQLSL